MDKFEMVEQWEKERGYIIERMNRFDKRLDDFDTKVEKQLAKIDSNTNNQWNKIEKRLDKNTEQIDELKVEVLKYFSGMTSFKSEFRIKTSSWVYLGIVTTILIALVIYVIKTQLV